MECGDSSPLWIEGLIASNNGNAQQPTQPTAKATNAESVQLNGFHSQMAVYSTFFTSDPSDLLSGFPDWKRPLEQPQKRIVHNPFTSAQMTIETREPEWEDVDSGDFQFPEMQVVTNQGDYGEYLEQRIPPFVRSRPHWCSKSLSSVELEPLVAVVTAVEEPRLEVPLYAHPSLSSMLEQFPLEFVAMIKQFSSGELEKIARVWAETMSSPDFTNSVSGEKLSEGWTVAEATCILTPIVDLARSATGDQRLYVLNEW